MIGTTFKRGVAMIELIFAIVVIGLVLTTTPMLIQQSINSSYVAIQQESIAATGSHMGLLLTKHWDELDANNSAGVAPIMHVNRDPFHNAGLTNVMGRATDISGTLYPPTAIGLDADETQQDFDDVDDANGMSFSLVQLQTSNVGDYLDQNITIATSVRFAEDQPLTGNVFVSNTPDLGNRLFSTNPGADTNIKLIEVTLTTNSDVDELNKSITMRAFSCNVGTYTIGKELYE